MPKFTEIQKNYFTCAILSVISGVGILLCGKIAIGVIAILLGVVFAVIPIVSYVKEGGAKVGERNTEEDNKDNEEASADESEDAE